MSIGLIADIGGTNARFAVCRPGDEAQHVAVLPVADYAGPAEAAQAYLKRLGPDVKPTGGAFAVASPVTGDTVAMTNHLWRFSTRAVGEALGFERLDVVNDFVAVALCVPRLTSGHRLKVGGGVPVDGAPVGVLGAGTGLGVAMLVPIEGRWHAVATEGGHVTMPAADDEEAAVLSVLRHRFGHVSAERVLSGPGLVNLHQAVAEVAGQPQEPLEAAVITERALSGSDLLCVRVLRLFLGMLGTVAGNLTLTTGALGGIYIAGGIVPRMAAVLDASPFRFRFEDKGRFRDYNARIPTYVITHPYPAFLGLSGLLAARK